ncbi:hypothetical protein BV22DRAFT_1197227 [Leucogyrophana mollusca]|uniref:Uncharacterized protein n=1 Tax=Leucogyrophana mollusca TaxID=85980 RepID=A0ACB8BA69_9AGAM|nr:hypothetical protein BV22DRAFT_1197227 [Leucogyrophana mollusca]
MGSEGIQITIPDFDDDDFQSTPIPFGRPAGFGAFGGAGSGSESPTILTPIALPERSDRSYFHSRGDSVASEDSYHSQPARHVPKPFAHTSQSSIATTSSSPFSKKPSFASIRNAFKSSAKHSDVPPMPTLDHQAYPILKNPFNRSTSSLAHLPSTSKPTNAISLPNPRPPTPGSNEARPRAASRARGHSTARSQHSQSGSIFHSSDTGSDLGHGFSYSSSPPPVPRMPAFGAPVSRSESPTAMDEDEKVPPGPRTPSDYALHAVFIRFATLAEAKMDVFLRESLDNEPLLSDFMGPTLDEKFDDLLRSLGKIAQKHAKPVIDSIMRWRRSHNESISSDILKYHASHSPPWNRGARVQEPSGILNERKSLASIYITCRALIAVLQMISKDALGDATGYSLEETTFEQFKKPDLKLLSQSANHRINAELYATMLGHLGNVRFVSVTDRFLSELGPVASGQVVKDLDTRYENLVKGLRHIQIKVWPPEAFEEGAEFMESLSKSFENAHGLRFKVAFAETLTRLLHPIGKTAQAEVNHPQWEKAIEKIYPRAKDMMSKPRYWHVAYPLAVTSLCVAPHQYFLRNWVGCFEHGMSKLKEKPYRIPVMNGMVRLIWTYLYRCQEPSSTSTAKLDTLLKHFFPAGRALIFPHEEHLEPFICIVHFVLSRYFEFGRDFCLELLQESSMNASAITAASLPAPERFAISIQAILLTLHAIEREEPTPTWPSSVDFSAVPSWDDYPSSSEILPPLSASKPGMEAFFDRYGVIITSVVNFCSNTVGQMSVFDEQWALARYNPAYEESHSMVIRRHAEGSVAYPNQLVSQISMLQTCFQSWPRCLHSSLPLAEAVEMLIRGVIHVEPRVGEVAAAALRRFMSDTQYAAAVLHHFTKFLFDPTHIVSESAGARIVLESARLLNLWVSLVEGWINGLLQRAKTSITDEEREATSSQSEDITAGALFLLSHEWETIRCAGVKLIRSLRQLSTHVASDSSLDEKLLMDLLHGEGSDKTYLQGFDELLDRTEIDRLQQWKQSARPDILLRIADSGNEKDRKLWRHIFPAFMRSCMQHTPKPLADCRAAVVAAASRYHPLILQLAGLAAPTNRSQTGPASRSASSEKEGYRLIKEHMPVVDQWHMWIKILCATAAVTDSRPAMTHAGREHTRAPSDSTFERERMSTTRCLFRYLTPFLDAEYTPFRDAAVLCISAFPSGGYSMLLEDLNLFAFRQFYDESRPKVASPVSAGRNRRQARLHSAVARIYYLTAHLLQFQRTSTKQDSLSHALKFVRNTQIFLTSPENRDNYALQRLRRYFCGLVERLFDGLANLADSERFIPLNMHLALYRLCEEWCAHGQPSEPAGRILIKMQRAAAAASHDPEAESSAGERFQHETKLLSNAAVGALAALCQKAYFPPDVAESSSPTERPAPDLKTLDASSTLDRIYSILSSAHPQAQEGGRKALRSLLAFPKKDTALLNGALQRAFVGEKDAQSTNALVFGVIADVVRNVPDQGFTFAQIVSLGLYNLCHIDPVIRRDAFSILKTIHERSFGVLSIAEFESLVGSWASSVYLHAHRLVSECLAGEHPWQAIDVLSQIAISLPRIHSHEKSHTALLLLQSLEHWVQNIQLITQNSSGGSQISAEGSTALFHLISITRRFCDSYPEQIAAIWTRLVDPPHEQNGRAAARFLMDHSLKVATCTWVKCGANIIACLSRTAIGRGVFDELCSIIDGERMLPDIDHRLARPHSEAIELWSDLDVVFTDDHPKLFLGSAQYAMLFIAEVAIERLWTFPDHVSIILAAVLAHLDHRVPFIRLQARHMFFQLLHSCLPGYAELSNRTELLSQASVKSAISAMENEGDSLFWHEDDTASAAKPRMKRICSEIVTILAPLIPDIAGKLGVFSLSQGVSCPIRTLAFRSLQVYRILSPPLTKDNLGYLIKRLSNTLAAPEAQHHPYGAELLLTFTSMISSEDLDKSLLPRMYWAISACLLTTLESEFSQALKLLEIFLSRADLEDPHMSDLIIAERPLGWRGHRTLQASLLTGLRSSVTLRDTFQALQSLTKITDSQLIDPTSSRLRDLFAASIPWCLHDMASDKHDASLAEFCTSVATLAELEGRDSISRIMTSFVKSRFRTKDDFLRQSVTGLREHYGADHWVEIATLLLGLVLNSERWLQVHTMQVLKVFFQQRDTRSTAQALGSEHLMPLLRLAEGELASQALDVLEEPLKIAGGPTAKQVLRMSMHTVMLSNTANNADVFGAPEESGWCIAQAHSQHLQCRANLLAVAETCQVPSNPPMVEFSPEEDMFSEPLTFTGSSPLEDDLPALVQDLYALNEFFRGGTKPQLRLLLPSQQLEERVASIMARSTDDSSDVPQTPYADVFRIGRPSDFSDASDTDSDSESEFDAFIFDSPTIPLTAPNGQKLR